MSPSDEQLLNGGPQAFEDFVLHAEPMDPLSLRPSRSP